MRLLERLSLITICVIREIPRGNLELSAFPCGRQNFFNPYDDLKFLTFPHGRQKGSVFINFTLFILNIMTFVQNRHRDHLNWPHIS